MSDTIYYNIWNISDNHWTNGFRRVNHSKEYQNSTTPWCLTREEVESWVVNDWGAMDSLKGLGHEIRELPAEYVAKYAEILVVQQEQRRREEHAQKYL